MMTRLPWFHDQEWHVTLIGADCVKGSGVDTLLSVRSRGHGKNSWFTWQVGLGIPIISAVDYALSVLLPSI